jgi:hypothetical protein
MVATSGSLGLWRPLKAGSMILVGLTDPQLALWATDMIVGCAD